MSVVSLSDGRDDGALARLIGADAIARVRRPIEEAAGLPNIAYTSEDFLRLENERLFAQTWMPACQEAEIAKSGDVVPKVVAGLPIVVLRDKAGEVRAFHNVCPHRGTRLVSEPCQGRATITCPYHAWSFDLTGALRGRPHYHGGGKHDVVTEDGHDIGLTAIRCETWLGMVFVNLSGDAPPLSEYLKPLTDRLGGYDLSALRYAGSLSFEVGANWKLAYENYIEPYHVFALHPRLCAFVPMELRTPSDFEGPVLFNEYLYPAAEEGRGDGLPHYPNLPADYRNRGLWFHLFPSLCLEIYPDQLAVFLATPLGPGRCREDIHIYLVGEAADGERHQAERQAVFDTWHDLNGEDLAVLEKLQAGRHSPAFTGGRLSPYWDAAPLHFARLVVDALS
ncbi:MAG: aromatic ring-hydroxylating dioxygenase subunit alpha [Pseudomonadota bacterium]